MSDCILQLSSATLFNFFCFRWWPINIYRTISNYSYLRKLVKHRMNASKSTSNLLFYYRQTNLIVSTHFLSHIGIILGFKICVFKLKSRQEWMKPNELCFSQTTGQHTLAGISTFCFCIFKRQNEKLRMIKICQCYESVCLISSNLLSKLALTLYCPSAVRLSSWTDGTVATRYESDLPVYRI